MRTLPLLTTLLCSVPALAQNWYVPNNDATTGACNVIPFGDPSPTSPSWSYQKYQTRCTSADLGAAVNIITGLGFAACGLGRAHYNQIEIVIDHIPAAQPLVSTFASNLTANAVTVLNATNYTWNLTANNAWHEVGLQNMFVYNGVDDIVVQITTWGGNAPMGFHRDVRQRLYWVGGAAPHGVTGTFGNAAGKIEVSMLTGKVSSHGDGCLGSNGTPRLSFSGSPVVGNTLSFDLTNGLPNGIALFFAGFSNAFPFPLDLSILGMPGCYEYTDLTVTSALLLDPVGAGSFVLPIPLSAIGLLFYGQFAVLDPAANAFGFTTSNYGRVHTGN